MMKVALALLLAVSAAAAQDGHYGQGHEPWHDGFYRNLTRPDYPGFSCCNMHDCRPTSMRVYEGRVEVKVDGQWVPAPPEKVLRLTAPDWGVHVCAGKGGTIFCIILPPET